MVPGRNQLQFLPWQNYVWDVMTDLLSATQEISCCLGSIRPKERVGIGVGLTRLSDASGWPAAGGLQPVAWPGL